MIRCRKVKSSYPHFCHVLDSITLAIAHKALNVLMQRILLLQTPFDAKFTAPERLLKMCSPGRITHLHLALPSGSHQSRLSGRHALLRKLPATEFLIFKFNLII